MRSSVEWNRLHNALLKCISWIACLAFDKSLILDDILQEATNTDILQIQIHIQIQIHWLLIKVLSWKIFCRKPQTGSFYHNLGRRLSASGDFQDTIISRHFTNSNTNINANTNTHSNTHTNKTWGQRLSLRPNVFKRKRKHQNLAEKDFPYHRYISIIVHSIFDTATYI